MRRRTLRTMTALTTGKQGRLWCMSIPTGNTPSSPPSPLSHSPPRPLTTGTWRTLWWIMISIASSTLCSGVSILSLWAGVMISCTCGTTPTSMQGYSVNPVRCTMLWPGVAGHAACAGAKHNDTHLHSEGSCCVGQP
jgi:hypothetical protein